MRFAGIDCPGCANHNGSSAQTHSANFRAAAITMRFRTSENPCCGNHNGSSAQRHFANIRATAITMRFRTSENPCCANHNGSSAQTHFANMRAAAITMRFAGNENRCYANHNGSSAHNRGGAQRQLRAPQPLLEALETAPATVESWGGPAATPRAAAPSRGSGDCARHCGELGGPSGDSARRSPFWRLCRLRPPLWRAENPCCGNHNGSSAQRHFANIRAAAITMRFRTSENPCCANHHGSSAQTHFANMRAAAITMRFAGNDENRCYANHNGSSAHNRGGAQRRLRAPQPLLQALETAPATVESWGGPAATPRAAAPSRGSGDCARHCGELGGPSSDSARRSPFWRLCRLLKDLHVPDNTNRSAEEMKMLICMRSM